MFNWHYVVNVKSTVKISSIFVAFFENMNFKYRNYYCIAKKEEQMVFLQFADQHAIS